MIETIAIALGSLLVRKLISVNDDDDDTSNNNDSTYNGCDGYYSDRTDTSSSGERQTTLSEYGFDE